MTGVLLPTTGVGVAAQFAVVVAGTAMALRLTRSHHPLRLLVIGLSLTLLGLLGLRAAH